MTTDDVHETASGYLDPAVLAAISPLALRTRRVVEGMMTGMHRSHHHGVSVEFAEHRPYVPGDDLRHLDWKVYGRSDKLYIRQYHQETNLEIRLVLDVSGSMGYRSNLAPWRKYDHAASLLAALAWLTLEQRDRVGLRVHDQALRAEVRPSGAGGHWHAITTQMEALAPGKGAEAATDLEGALTRVTAGGARRGLVVLASDLLGDPDALEDGLARLRHHGHDAVLLQVLDPAEARFPFRAPAAFHGLEGEATLRMDPAALRRGYLEAFEAHQGRLGEMARRFGFEHQVLTTDQPLGPPLAHLLARRHALVERGRR